MKKSYSQETGVTTWLVTEWWQKTMYVTGAIVVWYFVFCFLCGIVFGIFAAILS